MRNFRIEQIETTKGVDGIPKGFIKYFLNTNKHLPLDIDIEKRFAVFRSEGEKYIEEFRNFEVRKDDIWVVTMPKSGTTWMLEMVWLLSNDLDFETAKKIAQVERCPFLEHVAINPLSNSIEDAKNMKSPRVLKSHLPVHMLPKDIWTVKPKIIYVVRDPKDVIVSGYHFWNALGLNFSSLDEYANQAVNDRILYAPLWSHIEEFWKLRHESNVYFTSFERMKKDLRGEIVKVSNFLGKNVGKEQLDELIEHLSFDQMKSNQSCNNVKMVRYTQKINGVKENPMGVFIRKGKVGSYKEELNHNLIKTLEEWTQRSTKVHGFTLEEILFS